MLCFDGKNWQVQDLGSAQGSFLNGAELQEFTWKVLMTGDRLKFAESTRTYVIMDSDQPGPAKKRKTDSMIAPTQVRCRHLLVKHSKSRRPSSWRSPEGITRSEDEARDILEGYAQQLKAQPHRFGPMAAEKSDCSSARKDGDLGMFGRGKMQKPFEEAAFALSVGQMSDIVKSDSGLHLILREE